MVKRLLDIFFTVHAQKRLFRNFRSKIGPRHSLRRQRFPIIRVYFHYPMTFSAYIWCFVHNFHLTLWPWPSTFWPWRCLRNKELSNVLTNSYRPAIICSWVMCDSIWSYYLHLKRSLRMRRVTWPITRGQKWFTFLKPFNPIYLFTLSLLRCYDEF